MSKVYCLENKRDTQGACLSCFLQGGWGQWISVT